MKINKSNRFDRFKVIYLYKIRMYVAIEMDNKYK